MIYSYRVGLALRVGLTGILALAISLAGSPAAHADVTDTQNLLRRAIENTLNQGAFDALTFTTCNAPRCTFRPHAFTLTNGQVLRIHATKGDAGWYTSFRRMPSLRLLAAVGYTPRTGDWATREDLVPALRQRARAAGLPATGSVYGLDDQEHYRLDERAMPPMYLLPDTSWLATDSAAIPAQVSNLQSAPGPDGSTLVSWSYQLDASLSPCTSGTSQVVISPAEVITSSRTVSICAPESGIGSRTSESTASFAAVRIKGPVAPSLPLSAVE